MAERQSSGPRAYKPRIQQIQPPGGFSSLVLGNDGNDGMPTQGISSSYHSESQEGYPHMPGIQASKKHSRELIVLQEVIFIDCIVDLQH